MVAEVNKDVRHVGIIHRPLLEKCYTIHNCNLLDRWKINWRGEPGSSVS